MKHCSTSIIPRTKLNECSGCPKIEVDQSKQNLSVQEEMSWPLSSRIEGILVFDFLENKKTSCIILIQEWCPTSIHVPVLILASFLFSFQLLSFFLPSVILLSILGHLCLHCCLPPATCRHWPHSAYRSQASHLSYPPQHVLHLSGPGPSSLLSHSSCDPMVP